MLHHIHIFSFDKHVKIVIVPMSTLCNFIRNRSTTNFEIKPFDDDEELLPQVMTEMS